MNTNNSNLMFLVFKANQSQRLLLGGRSSLESAMNKANQMATRFPGEDYGVGIVANRQTYPVYVARCTSGILSIGSFHNPTAPLA